MSDQDLFQKKDDAPPATPDVNQLLDLVKREDGSRKYNTLEDLVKGTTHAQEHIKKLETELQALKEGKEKAALEAILEKLQPPASPPPATPAAPTAVPLDVIEQAVTAIEAKKIATANSNAIKADLIKVAGSEAAAATLFQEKAAGLGLSTSDLSALAAKSPAVVRKLLGIGEQDRAPTKTHPSIVPGALPPSDAPRKRVMLGGATSAEQVEAFRKHRPQ